MANAITPTDLGALEATSDPIEREVMAVQGMKQLRWDLIRLRAVRQVAIRELVDEHGVTEVSRLLKLSRETVYKLLEADPRHDEVLENKEAPFDESLSRRLAENEQLLKNIASGKTPSIPLESSGARLLADLLREARVHLQS